MNQSQEDSDGRLQGDLDGYHSGKPAVLDHLVPIDERKEDAPALLLQGEHSLRSPFTVIWWCAAPSRSLDRVKAKIKCLPITIISKCKAQGENVTMNGCR